MNIAKAPGVSSWSYFLGREAFIDNAGAYMAIKVLENGVVKTMWTNDGQVRTPIPSNPTIPWAPAQTYSFYTRINGVSSAYSGVFLRGGNVVRGSCVH